MISSSPGRFSAFPQTSLHTYTHYTLYRLLPEGSVFHTAQLGARLRWTSVDHSLTHENYTQETHSRTGIDQASESVEAPAISVLCRSLLLRLHLVRTPTSSSRDFPVAT